MWSLQLDRENDYTVAHLFRFYQECQTDNGVVLACDRGFKKRDRPTPLTRLNSTKFSRPWPAVNVTINSISINFDCLLIEHWVFRTDMKA